MNNSQEFSYKSLKRMPMNRLIEKCRQYVKKYVSASAASRLDKAYKAARFDEVKYILEKALEQIKAKIDVSEYEKAKKVVKDEFHNEDRLFDSSNNNEGGQDDNMSAGNGMVTLIVISVAILAVSVVGTVLYLKFKGKNINFNNQTVGEVLSYDIKKGNSVKYTEKDKDLLELIHELSVIYDNTDRYLNS